MVVIMPKNYNYISRVIICKNSFLPVFNLRFFNITEKNSAKMSINKVNKLKESKFYSLF